MAGTDIKHFKNIRSRINTKHTTPESVQRPLIATEIGNNFAIKNKNKIAHIRKTFKY